MIHMAGLPLFGMHSVRKPDANRSPQLVTGRVMPSSRNIVLSALLSTVLVALLAPAAQAEVKTVGWYGAATPCSTSYTGLGGPDEKPRARPLVMVQVCTERTGSYLQAWALVHKGAPGLVTVGAQTNFFERTPLSSYAQRNVSTEPQSYFGSVTTQPCDIAVLPRARIVFFNRGQYVFGERVPPPCYTT
jgi:hypothetical protein